MSDERDLSADLDRLEELYEQGEDAELELDDTERAVGDYLTPYFLGEADVGQARRDQMARSIVANLRSAVDVGIIPPIVPESWKLHVVEFTPSAWSMEHSVECRTGRSLLDCPLHAAIERDCQDGPPPGVAPGRYEVRADDARPAGYRLVAP